MEVLQQLRGDFDSVMDGLGDSDLDDRSTNLPWSFVTFFFFQAAENFHLSNTGVIIQKCRDNTGWDVRLAVEYKDTQRRIVSSILTSCYSGLRLVEDAWCKCIAEDIRG